MGIDIGAYRQSLCDALVRLRPHIDAGRIIGDDSAQFLLVEKCNRGVEIYCGEGTTVCIDPAIGEELQGEVDFPSYDVALDAAIQWLNGADRTVILVQSIQ